LSSIPPLASYEVGVVVERSNFTFYFPIVTSILLSLILSGIFWLLRR